jgi:hypothetical protein
MLEERGLIAPEMISKKLSAQRAPDHQGPGHGLQAAWQAPQAPIRARNTRAALSFANAPDVVVCLRAGSPWSDAETGPAEIYKTAALPGTG